MQRLRKLHKTKTLKLNLHWSFRVELNTARYFFISFLVCPECQFLWASNGNISLLVYDLFNRQRTAILSGISHPWRLFFWPVTCFPWRVSYHERVSYNQLSINGHMSLVLGSTYFQGPHTCAVTSLFRSHWRSSNVNTCCPRKSLTRPPRYAWLRSTFKRGRLIATSA